VKAVYTALANFGARLEGLNPKDFSVRGKSFRIDRGPVAVDILPEIDGVDFDRAWEKRVEGVIDTQPVSRRISFLTSSACWQPLTGRAERLAV